MKKKAPSNKQIVSKANLLGRVAHPTKVATGHVKVKAPSMMFVLRLLNETLWEVESSDNGILEKDVPAGLYLARCEMGGPAAQKGVRVEEGKTVEIVFLSSDLPRMPSAAPVSGAANNHEYYSKHLFRTSCAKQADACWKKGKTRLIIMSRGIEELEADKPKQKVRLKGFRLLTAKGELVSDFTHHKMTDEIIQRKKDDALMRRASFSIDLAPGGYLLAWPAGIASGRQHVCLPIWVCNGHVTGVFLAVRYGEKHPSPDMVSVQMAPAWDGYSGGFKPGDFRAAKTRELLGTATELALASLRTGRRQISSRMLNELLYDKFTNPMSGILGAYMLCQRDKPDWPLFDKVVSVLHDKVPGHPDLAGLIALAAQRGHLSGVLKSTVPQAAGAPGTRGAESMKTAAAFPPTLRLGIQAFAEQQWVEERTSVKSGSLTELACLHASPTNVWTTFTLPDSLPCFHKPKVRKRLETLAEVVMGSPEEKMRIQKIDTQGSVITETIVRRKTVLVDASQHNAGQMLTKPSVGDVYIPRASFGGRFVEKGGEVRIGDKHPRLGWGMSHGAFGSRMADSSAVGYASRRKVRSSIASVTRLAAQQSVGNVRRWLAEGLRERNSLLTPGEMGQGMSFVKMQQLSKVAERQLKRMGISRATMKKELFRAVPSGS